MAAHLHSLPAAAPRELDDTSGYIPRISRLPSRSENTDVWALSTLGSALLHAAVIAPMIYFGAKMIDTETRYAPPPMDTAPIANVAVKLSDFDKPKEIIVKVEPPTPPKVVEAKPEVKPEPKPEPKIVKKTPPRKTAKKRKTKRRRVIDNAPDGRAQRLLSKSDKPAPNGPSPSDLKKAGSGAVGDGPPPPKVAGDPKGTRDGIGSEPATPKAPKPVITPVIDTAKVLRRYLRKVARAVRKDFKYPRAAVRAGMEGKAVVAVIIDAQGRIVGAKLTKSSGYAILDKAAVSAAKSISKVPKAPEELEWSRRQVKIPFKFRLRT